MRRLFEATRRVDDGERCELCNAPLAVVHDHVFAPTTRELRCVCTGCVLIQTDAYRRVPRRFTSVRLDSANWLARAGVPVGVAAVIVHDDGRTAVAYPGVAGLVEAELVDPFELPPLEREVEALLCSSLPGGGAWIAGIDVVFELIGELRRHWRGLTGGPEATAAIARVLAAHAGGAR